MKKQFGGTLRAYRFGYRELGYIGFLRIAAEGSNWRIDLCPYDGMPKPVSKSKEYVCWWEGDTSAIYLTVGNLIGPGDRDGMGCLLKPLSFLVDDDGEIVT